MAAREEKVKTLRILEIDRLIREGGCPNATALGKRFEVSRSTIMRDIDFLRDRYRAPLEYDSARNGFYYTDPTFFVKSVMLSEGELFAVSVIAPLLEQYRNTPLEGSFRSILSKLTDMLPRQVSVDTTFVSREISFISDPLPEIAEDVFNMVFKALRTSRRVEFEYRSLGSQEHSARCVEPYHVVCQKGNWYVMGLCLRHRDVRIFSLSRMRKLRVTDERFSVPADFEPDAYIDPSVGVWINREEPVRIELLFSPGISTYILERRWHTTQEISQEADGSVRLSFLSNQMQETLHWVMSFGPSVRVLNPPGLARKVREEAERTAALYR